MPIYFIQAGDGGPVKIGVASDVQRRLSAFRTASAESLFLRALYEGDREAERRLHGRFANQRVAREWFAASVLAEEIDLPALPLPTKGKPAVTALDRAIKAAGSATRLAAILGVHKSTISDWKSGGVPAERAVQVERATGVPRALLRPDNFEANP